MAILHTAIWLAVSVGAGTWATWLLIRVDRLAPGRRRLGRRGLMAVSAAAAAAVYSLGWEVLHEAAFFLSLYLMMALSMAWSLVHYRQRTRLWVYQLELAILWGLWAAGVHVGSGRPVRLTGVVIMWSLFAVFGGLALYPARRRHLRRLAAGPETSVP